MMMGRGSVPFSTQSTVTGCTICDQYAKPRTLILHKALLQRCSGKQGEDHYSTDGEDNNVTGDVEVNLENEAEALPKNLK